MSKATRQDKRARAMRCLGEAPADVYRITPAKYAKGMIAVRCPSVTGYKTQAARLAEYFARNRYSGREHAYIMSAATGD